MNNGSKRVNYNQLTPEERKQYWESYKKLGESVPIIPTEGVKIDDCEAISKK